MTLHRGALAVLGLALLSASANAALQFKYDQVLTESQSNNISAYGSAGSLGASPIEGTTTEHMLVQNYTQPSGTYDWGNEATASAHYVDPLANGSLTGSVRFIRHP